MKSTVFFRFLFALLSLSALKITSGTLHAKPQVVFQSDWPTNIQRHWIGPDYWANRLQDWQIRAGRLECLQPSPKMVMRTVHVISLELIPVQKPFQLKVRTGLLGYGSHSNENSWSGFLISAGHGKVHYKSASLIHHYSGTGGGLIAALDDEGKLVFRSNELESPKDSWPLLENIQWDGQRVPRSQGSTDNWEDILLELDARPSGNGLFELELSAVDFHTGKQLSQARLTDVDEAMLRGNIALVSHGGKGEQANRYWFKDLVISGDKVVHHPDRAFGPVLNTLYTYSNKVLKMTAQLPPLGFMDPRTATLYTRRPGTSHWTLRQKAEIVYPGYVARFRVEPWDDTTEYEYQVRYASANKTYSYNGLITRNPGKRDNIVVAGFTGNQAMGRPADDGWGASSAGGAKGRWIQENLWFPHTPVTNNIPKHKTDLLFFSGDQIYEGGSPTNSDHTGRFPELDFFYKWFIWCWDYQTITRNLPSIVIVDDHDVYQGDLWGNGGDLSLNGNNKQGGYVEDPEFVRMVERVCCSHNPDPYDPTPVKNGIGVYYGEFTLGEVGFAFLEDRKFKSLPGLVPNRKMSGSKIVNEGYDPKDADIAGAKLLGDRQIAFLGDWVHDWTDQKMKVALMQTTFASLHTRHDRQCWLDMDSNGWPQSARNKALKVLRKGHVFMFAGDTHLAAIVQHGTDDWRDAGYCFVVPSLSNKYRRWWDPAVQGKQPITGEPPYTGDNVDGFLNKVTVYAAGNPLISSMEVYERNGGAKRYASSHMLLDRTLTKDGYGIIILNKAKQTITMECWPWHADYPQTPQYRGWPRSISVADNYARKAVAWLPALRIRGMNDPVVQVINEATSEVLYTIRALNGTYRPKVFHKGTYTIKVFEPGTDRSMTLTNIPSESIDSKRVIEVEL